MPDSVLLVDDAADLAEAVRTRIEAAGYEFLHAPDGTSGFAAARRYRPTIILLDVNMPDIDGFAVRRALAGDPTLARIPVIFLTGDAIAAAERQPFDPSANVFIAKPFDSGDLLRAIGHAIASAPQV